MLCLSLVTTHRNAVLLKRIMLMGKQAAGTGAVDLNEVREGSSRA